MYKRQNQSYRSGRVKLYRLPYSNAPTAATYPPFFKSADVNAVYKGWSLTPNDSRPSFAQNFTRTVSPGPYPFLKSVPSLLDPLRSLPVEQQAQPSLMSEKARLTLGISECLTMPILKQVPLCILISQQQTPCLSMTKSAQLFLQTPVEVLTATVPQLSFLNSRQRLRLRGYQFRQMKLGCIDILSLNYYNLRIS